MHATARDLLVPASVPASGLPVLWIPKAALDSPSLRRFARTFLARSSEKTSCLISVMRSYSRLYPS